MVPALVVRTAAVLALVAPMGALAPVTPQTRVVWNVLVITTSVAVMAFAVHRRRPRAAQAWWLLTGGLALFVGRAWVISAFRLELISREVMQAAETPLFLAGFALTVAASARLVRLRVGRRDVDGLIDAAIVGCAAAVVVKERVVPLGGIEDSATVTLLVVLEAIVVAIAIRLLILSFDVPAGWLLFAGSLAGFIANITFVARFAQNQQFIEPGLVVAWNLAYVLSAAAAVHPSMRRLTELRSDTHRKALDRARLAVLSVAILVAPVSVLLHGGGSADPFSALGVSVLTTLSLWRLARLLIARERHAEQQAALVRLGEAVARADSVGPLLAAAATEVACMLRAPAAVVTLVGAELSLQASSGGEWSARLPAELPSSTRPQRVETPGGPVVAVVVGDSTAPHGGILVATARVLDAEELAGLRVVANLLSAAVHRHTAESALRHASLHDALTGLPNRLLLDDRLQAASRRARRAGRSYGVLFVDLDGFKAVNDTLGHGAGDAVLVTTASRMLATVRGVDTVARVSGDEFVIVLDDIDAERLELVTGRLLAAVSPAVTVASGVALVTASIGAVLVQPDGDPDVALQTADAAMYDAKRSGKARASLVG